MTSEHFTAKFPPKILILYGGLLLGIGANLVPAPEGMSPAAWRVSGLTLWMALWWLTEVIPVYVTALLPLIVLPMVGITDFKTAALPYAHPLIFLFMGGFIVAKAIESCHLHRRVALVIVGAFGTRPDYLIGGFMMATAFLSMWISNTATTVMMLPIAISVTDLFRENENSGSAPIVTTAMLLGIAYSASIGGLGTLVGSPPNALLAAFVQEQLDIQIGFTEWMIVGLPAVGILLPIAWLLLTRIVYRVPIESVGERADVVADKIGALGPMSPAEIRVSIIFSLMALGWICRPFIVNIFPDFGLTDSGIALLAAISLFTIPSRRGSRRALVTWTEAVTLPWGILLLFGGGLSLAAAISMSGLAVYIGDSLAGLSGLPSIGLVILVTMVVIFLTEITSNTATAAVFLPIVTAIAIHIGIAPLQLVIPVALAASCAFMMPVATPPNAIIFASERLTTADMAKAGICLNLIATVVIVLISVTMAE